MNVVMISPGFPAEQPFYTRALARLGANVIGVGDQPQSGLPPMARDSLAAYFQVPSFADEHAVINQIKNIAGSIQLERIECTWEPFMTLAARAREALGISGMKVEQTVPFRDKEIMKRVLDQNGIRTPYHFSSVSAEGVRDAAREIGYPIC